MATGNFGIFLLVGLSILGSALAGDVLEGNYNVTAFCTSVPVGTPLGSIVSCNYYYVCTQSGPVNTSCSAGYSFDLANRQCNPSDQVNCYYGVADVCANKKGDNWVPITGTCNGWIYCNGTVNSGNGTCGANQKFDAASSSCVWGKCSTASSPSDEPVLTSLCEVVPPGFYFGDTENCAAWNYCLTNGTLEYGSCTTQKLSAFIVSTKSCGYSSDAVCSRVTGDSLGTASVECSQSGQLKPDNTTCGTYYICNGQTWQEVNCDYGYYYDTVAQKCVARQNAVAAIGCNRCQYSTKTFVNAVNHTTCGTYLYCNNGVGTLTTCKADYFFNEQLQGCVPDSDLSDYVPDNGACYGASVSGGSGTTSADGTTSSGDGSTASDGSTGSDDTTASVTGSTSSDSTTDDDTSSSV